MQLLELQNIRIDTDVPIYVDFTFKKIYINSFSSTSRGWQRQPSLLALVLATKGAF